MHTTRFAASHSAHRASHTRALQRGTTLVEASIVLAIIAIVLGSALPSLQQARLHRHMDGAAAQLETDIQLTRSRAVAEGRALRMSFIQDAAGSCYVVHAGNAGSCSCDASGRAQCTNGQEALRSVRYGHNHPVRLQSNVNSISFNPDLGTSTPTGTVRVQTSAQHTVHAVVNVMGRVRHCAPVTATAVKGYPGC